MIRLANKAHQASVRLDTNRMLYGADGGGSSVVFEAYEQSLLKCRRDPMQESLAESSSCASANDQTVSSNAFPLAFICKR